MIALGCFYHPVSVMETQPKKYSIIKGIENEEKKKLKGRKSEAVFFKDMSNYFSLLNLRSLIERFGLPIILWEREREKFIKYVKAEMNTIQDTKKYMSGVLNNLLQTHCLNNFMKENQFFQEASVSKTREFKVYSNR